MHRTHTGHLCLEQATITYYVPALVCRTHNGQAFMEQARYVYERVYSITTALTAAQC